MICQKQMPLLSPPISRKEAVDNMGLQNTCVVMMCFGSGMIWFGGTITECCNAVVVEKICDGLQNMQVSSERFFFRGSVIAPGQHEGLPDVYSVLCLWNLHTMALC